MGISVLWHRPPTESAQVGALRPRVDSRVHAYMASHRCSSCPARHAKSCAYRISHFRSGWSTLSCEDAIGCARICLRTAEVRPGVPAVRNPALDAWGDYDRDNPFPLFAQVRADDPVHEVTLADGHRAWLIVRHDEAKAALNHAGLSKDMHAALARDGAVVAEGL